MKCKNIYHIAIALITLAAFLCQAAPAKGVWVVVEKLLQLGQLRPQAAGERGKKEGKNVNSKDLTPMSQCPTQLAL